MNNKSNFYGQAGVAQLAEQLNRNQQVAGSSPITGSSYIYNKILLC